ncbi:MAG: hypothetical protein V7L11_04130 [Nostoc sp.]
MPTSCSLKRGLGTGNWGLGTGDWGLGTAKNSLPPLSMPNLQSLIPNP